MQEVGQQTYFCAALNIAKKSLALLCIFISLAIFFAGLKS